MSAISPGRVRVGSVRYLLTMVSGIESSSMYDNGLGDHYLGLGRVGRPKDIGIIRNINYNNNKGKGGP